MTTFYFGTEMTIEDLLEALNPNNTHKHRCMKCTCVWEHSRKDLIEKDVFEKGHMCPVCGAEQYDIYYGPEQCRTQEQIQHDRLCWEKPW